MAVTDTWLPSTGAALSGSYFNATEHLRLVRLGLVPRDADSEIAERAERLLWKPGEVTYTPPAELAAGLPVTPTGRSTGGSATPPTPTEGGTMTVAEKPRAKAKKTGLASLSKAKLREKLLATPTISDHAWNAAYGAPEREKGETREQYIRRVLS